MVKLNDTLRYQGPIKSGKFHGLGRIATKKGEIIYEGEFYEGRYDGKGRLWNYLGKIEPKEAGFSADIIGTYLSGSSNNYLKDLRGNKGILDVNFNENNWVFYEGFFRNGKKHGIGELKLNDGRFYTGEFKQGLANGMGLLKYFDQGVAGTWKDNICVQFL